VPWSEQALFDYLRHGVSREHGSASGPMAAVVGNLAELPDADLRAMAVYLASFNAPNPQGAADAAARVQSAAARAPLPGPAQRLFEGACAACHHDGDGPRLLGANVPLALNTNLHASRPDNLLRVILEGVQAPPSHAVGFMPGFGQALSDIQIAELAAWMRARYAPDQPAWNGLTEAVRQARESVCKTCKNDS
jgi:nicotinate dehydrogenase subunit B